MKIVPLRYKGIITKYFISDIGVVYNKKHKEMKPRFNPNGYMQACIRIDKKYVYPYIHRLVYESFTEMEIPKFMEINHINGKKWDNSLSNLTLVSRMDNIAHSWETGLAYAHNPYDQNCKEIMLDRKYKKKFIHKLCKTLAGHPELTYVDIANQFEVDVSIIYLIAKGKLWKDIADKYDIKGRSAKKREMYEERDKKIKQLRVEEGLKMKEIAEILGISFDAVARRIYLMRKGGML